MLGARKLMKRVMKRTATGCHAVLLTYGDMEPALPSDFTVLHLALPAELPVNRVMTLLQVRPVACCRARGATWWQGSAWQPGRGRGRRGGRVTQLVCVLAVAAATKRAPRCSPRTRPCHAPACLASSRQNEAANKLINKGEKRLAQASANSGPGKEHIKHLWASMRI